MYIHIIIVITIITIIIVSRSPKSGPIPTPNFRISWGVGGKFWAAGEGSLSKQHG